MQVAVSRNRETLADVSAVQLTRYPPGLISALEKLRDDTTVAHSASKATAHLWIEQPMAGVGTRAARGGSTSCSTPTHRSRSASRCSGSSRTLLTSRRTPRRDRAGRCRRPPRRSLQRRLEGGHTEHHGRRRHHLDVVHHDGGQLHDGGGQHDDAAGGALPVHRPARDRPRHAEPPRAGREDRQPRRGPPADRAEPGRRRVRGDGRGDHPVLRRVPVGQLDAGRARSARPAPPTSTSWPRCRTRCSPGRAATRRCSARSAAPT